MSDEDEIRELEERLRQGDLSAEPDTSAVFDELLADDVRIVTPTGIIGKNEVLSAHRPPERSPFSKLESTDKALRNFGNAIAVTCRTEVARAGRSTALLVYRLWIRREAGWKLVLMTQTEVPETDR